MARAGAIGRGRKTGAVGGLVAAVLLAAWPALADWPTTSFLPVPPGAESPDELIDSDFEPYVADADRTEEAGGLRGLSVTGLDVTALKRGAVGALTDIMRLVAIDAARMEAAAFPAPKIEPLLRVEETGQAFYPIFWVSNYNFAGTFKHECRTDATTFAGKELEFTRSYLWRIFANGSSNTPGRGFPYSRLDSAWGAGGARRAQMFDYMSSQLTHEVVHGVQASGYGDDGCGDSPGWLSEGLADGTAYYLLGRRSPGVFDRETWSRNERRYDIPLDTRGAPAASREGLAYGAGSFYRYLMEASEGGDTDGLAIAKDILTMPPSAARSTPEIYAELDRIIGAHSGGRTLFRVFPEFLTEYGSYGEGRYKKAGGGGALDRETWIEAAFDGCVEFPIKPGEARMKEIVVQPLAGECVKVSWSGYTQPVALQLYGMDAGDGFGALHVGEAMRDDASGRRFCHDVTKGLTRRIAEPMRKKCMLKRETRALGGAGAGVGNEAAWTSDFNLSGSGDVHFVISNIAPGRDQARDVPASAEAARRRAHRPAGETEPVVSGMTDPQKRVHTMNGAGDRIFFDGRSIFGDGTGLGYLEGVAGAMGPGEGPGVMTLVRGGDYWVGYVGARPGQSELGDGGLIIKDPVRLESGNPMAGVIMSGGMEHMPSGSECGYKLPAEVSIVEETRERVRFRVSGDLFDPMRAMALAGSGGASTCEMMRAMWVESAAFEVSLPNGALHAGDSWVERRSPPGQEVYDETDFLSGPNLGGIASSLSLAAGDAPPEDEPDAPPDDSDTTAGGGGSAGQLVACDCSCPDPARPDPATSPNPQCVAQCAAEWATCRASGDAAVARGTESTPEPTPERREPTVEAQRKWFSRLVSDQGLAPEVEAMLIDDFATMSADTRMHLIREYRRGLP